MNGIIIKTIFAIFLAFGIFLASGIVYAAEPVTVYFFHGDGCPHCAEEEEFLDVLEERDDVEVKRFEVWHNADNRAILSKAADALGATFNGVPITIVGERAIVGWSDAETSGAHLLRTIQSVQEEHDADIVGSLITHENSASPDTNTSPTEKEIDYESVALPSFITQWGTALSLPVITVLFAAVDGFNPCAMWALVFLITLLFGMKNRKRMWILGSAFILASGAVYFLFMAAWLNLILFLGFIVWVRIIIGLIALAGGAYYLYEWKTAPEAGCKVTDESQKTQLIERMKRAIGHKSFALALIGIVVVAALVNLVELVCSAGLPATYAQVLALHDLATWQYYGYLLLYVLVFMLDDMVIFAIAMTTLSLTGIGNKYTRASHLIGGILMVIIGLLLIFKPEILLFG